MGFKRQTQYIYISLLLLLLLASGCSNSQTKTGQAIAPSIQESASVTPFEMGLHCGNDYCQKKSYTLGMADSIVEPDFTILVDQFYENGSVILNITNASGTTQMAINYNSNYIPFGKYTILVDYIDAYTSCPDVRYRWEINNTLGDQGGFQIGLKSSFGNYYIFNEGEYNRLLVSENIPLPDQYSYLLFQSYDQNAQRGVISFSGPLNGATRTSLSDIYNYNQDLTTTGKLFAQEINKTKIPEFVSSTFVDAQGNSIPYYEKVNLGPNAKIQTTTPYLYVPYDAIHYSVNSLQPFNNSYSNALTWIWQSNLTQTLPLGSVVNASILVTTVYLNIDSHSVHTHQQLTLDPSREMRISTGLIANDNAYGTNVGLTARTGAMKYCFAFDTPVNLSTITPSNPLEISFLNNNLKILRIIDDASLTIQLGQEVFLNVGYSTFIDGNTVKLEQVGETSAVVSVNGISKSIDEGNTDTFGVLKVKVQSIFLSDTQPDSSAILIIGVDVEKTFTDGDAYIGQDPDVPDWVWSFTNLTKLTGQQICVQNEFNIDQYNDGVKLPGQYYELPEQFAQIGIQSLSVPDDQYMNFDVEYRVNDLSQAGGSSTAKTFTLTAGTDDGIVLPKTGNFTTSLPSNINTKVVYLVLNQSKVAVYYKDPSDANRVHYAGQLEMIAKDNISMVFGNFNYGNTTGTDMKLVLSGDSNVYNNMYLGLIPAATQNDAVWIQLGYGAAREFTGTGNIPQTEQAEELRWGSATDPTAGRNIGTKDEDERTAYGMRILNPKASGAADKYRFYIPSDQVLANLLVNYNGYSFYTGASRSVFNLTFLGKPVSISIADANSVYFVTEENLSGNTSGKFQQFKQNWNGDSYYGPGLNSWDVCKFNLSHSSVALEIYENKNTCPEDCSNLPDSCMMYSPLTKNETNGTNSSSGGGSGGGSGGNSFSTPGNAAPGSLIATAKQLGYTVKSSSPKLNTYDYALLVNENSALLRSKQFRSYQYINPLSLNSFTLNLPTGEKIYFSKDEAQQTEQATPAKPQSTKSYIVMLKGDSVIQALAKKDALLQKQTGSRRSSSTQDVAKLVADQKTVIQKEQDAILTAFEDKKKETTNGITANVISETPATTLIIKKRYANVMNGFTVDLTPEDLDALSQVSDVKRIVPNKQVQAFLNESLPIISVPEVWNMKDAQGNAITGKGVKVAVIDTGVDYNHPDLGGCFGQGCKVAGGYDFYNQDTDPLDDNGHGTHVAATIAGKSNTLRGVAPDATIYAYKVLSAYGSGSFEDVLSGIELAVDPNKDGDYSDAPDVISMSLGGSGDPDDPLSLAIDAAAAVGVTSAIAAGNAGPSAFTVGSPGTARTAITVGATTKCDELASFSSRGPVNTKNETLLKPEVLAPGVAICAAKAAGTQLGNLCADDSHISISGTSMATPHVSGVIALIKQAHPEYTPAQIKSLLMLSATDLGLFGNEQGSGRINVEKAINTPFVASPQTIILNDFTTGTVTYQLAITNLQNSLLTVELVGSRAEVKSSMATSGNSEALQNTVRNLNTSITLNPQQTMYLPIQFSLNDSFEGYLSGLVYLKANNVMYHMPFFAKKLSQITLVLNGEGKAVYPSFYLFNNDFSVFEGRTQFYDFEGNQATFDVVSGNYVVHATGDDEDWTYEYFLTDTISVGKNQKVTKTFKVSDARPYTIKAKSFSGKDLYLSEWEKMLVTSNENYSFTMTYSDPDVGDRKVYVSNTPNIPGMSVDVAFKYIGIPYEAYP